MEARIQTIPQNEQELVDIKAFIEVSKTQTKEQLMNLLLQVYKHMQMLDDYSEVRDDGFRYKEEDIQEMYMLYRWPLMIDATIADGQTAMESKTEEFTANLDIEKEQFAKDLGDWQEKFKKI